MNKKIINYFRVFLFVNKKNKMRDKIDFLSSSSMTEVEHFMHQTLRPILKEKNEIIQLLSSRSIENMEKNFSTFSIKKQQELLGSLIQKNISFRNQIIGIVLASMRIDEIDIYFKYQKEINKRILQMAEVRILSRFQKKDLI